MNSFSAFIVSITASVFFMTVALTAQVQPAQSQHAGVADNPSAARSALLQQKATEAQARIHANKQDRDQLMTAIKTNEVPLARQVLLRNGFTAEDLDTSKIVLQTGGGKGGDDEIEVLATCCNPKEITIRRSLSYFTK